MKHCFFMWQDGCVLDSSATAAWAQAFLSAAAILAAWLLQEISQRRSARREQRNEERALRVVAATISAHVVTCWQVFTQSGEFAVDALSVQIPSLVADAARLDAVSIQRLAEGELTGPTAQLRAGLTLLNTILTRGEADQEQDTIAFATSLAIVVPALLAIHKKGAGDSQLSPEAWAAGDELLRDAQQWAGTVLSSQDETSVA